MIFGFILGINTEARLKHVSESVFPATLLSKAALSEFNEQVKLYKDAVVFGEQEILDNAKIIGMQAQKSLQSLHDLFITEKKEKQRIRLLLNELNQFTMEASSFYPSMISQMDDEALTQKAMAMISRIDSLRAQLTALTATYSNNLKSQLVAVGNATRNQRIWNLVVFLIVVSVSLILVSVIIFRAVTRPLQKAAALAGAMAQGDLSRQLDIQQKDEIGGLARAMNAMAEKIVESQSLLEQKVADRTASLEESNQKLRAEIGERERAETELKQTQDKLRETARLADEANKSKSEFLANMSHEIRTPLTGVIGMTEILMTTPLTHEQQDYTETIKVSGETLLVIINDILDISKIEAGEFTLAAAPFSLKKAMDSIQRIFSPQAHKKGLQFNIVFQPGPVYRVIGDDIRVRQIIFNLVGNALKFTTQGKIEIRVKQGEVVGDMGKFFIEIEDTGIGIEPDYLENIFNKFTQVDSSNTRKYGGTGLGLYITRQLVGLMDGSIVVQSEVGKGSVFFIILSLRMDTEVRLEISVPEEEEKIKQMVPPEQGETRKLLNILLAEDNKINQKFISTIIKKSGHSLDIANNGVVAVEMVKAHGYDLVLMDIQMPEMNGLDATRAIRSAGFVALPVIAMTASAFEKDRKLCLEAGMNDFISKPLKQAELFSVLSRYEK